MEQPFKLIFANAEAIQILAYPSPPNKIESLEPFLGERLRAILLNGPPSSQIVASAEFMSGRRRYKCRAFSFNSHSANSSGQPTLALLLERSGRGSFDGSQVAARYHFTPREQETLQFLLHGLTNKEIAVRMNISPNTVKAFLKLIMIKMGVTTRSGIVGKIFETQT